MPLFDPIFGAVREQSPTNWLRRQTSRFRGKKDQFRDHFAVASGSVLWKIKGIAWSDPVKKGPVKKGTPSNQGHDFFGEKGHLLLGAFKALHTVTLKIKNKMFDTRIDVGTRFVGTF